MGELDIGEEHAEPCQLPKPGVVMIIEGKEDVRHLAVTVMEESQVICLHGMLVHEQYMRLVDERHPEQGGLSQMPPPHALLERNPLSGVVLQWLYRSHSLRVLYSNLYPLTVQ